MKKIPSVMMVWSTQARSEADFENSLGLLTMLQEMKKRKYRTNIQILLEDSEGKISQMYKARLVSLGCSVTDVSHIYAKLLALYPSLAQFGTYECHCFLRWLVIEQVLGNVTYLHYDADIIFNEDPRIIARRASVLTNFVLQGCPAFALVSPAWTVAYRRELSLFAVEPAVYSHQAALRRDVRGKSKLTKWAGSWDRSEIRSDQDLISYLIHRSILPQDTPRAVQQAFADYLLFENPLYVDECLSAGYFPLRYTRQGKVDYLGSHRVLMWHMQSYFVRYLARACTLRRLGLSLTRLHNPLFSSTWLDSGLDYLVKLFGYRDRQRIYQEIFRTTLLKQVLRDTVWWKSGVFT